VFACAPGCSAISVRTSEAGNATGRGPGAFAPFGCCDALVKRSALPRDGEVGVPPREKRYLLEWVGLEAPGVIAHSRWHHEIGGGVVHEEGSKCLTAGGDDVLRGVALGFATCRGGAQGTRLGRRKADGTIEDAGEQVIQAARRAAQEFTLTEDGKLKSSGGLCVRRMPAHEKCSSGDEGHFYDLGNCNGEGMVATFIVSRAIRNSVEELMLMGHPAQAVKEDACTSCGPYLLQERCLSGGGPTTGAPGCPPDYHARPGWSKLPATYVGDPAVEGRAGIDRDRSVASSLSFNDPVADVVTMSGLGDTSTVGMCGSFVTDAPYLNSLFYLHQVD